MPGSKQPCPIVAACWSPATPRSRIGPPNSAGFGRAEVAGAVVDGRQHRRRHAEQRAQSRRPSAALPMSSSSVRDALVTSVACTLAAGQAPQQEAVDRAERQLALLGARARAGDVIEQPGDLRRGEIRIEHQAGARWISAARGPAVAASAQTSAVRRSCQTMALWIGRPVARSHTTVVSRWLVMPIAATLRASTPACAMASRQTVATVVVQISSGSCSTCPGPDRSARIPAARTRPA